MEDLHSKTDWPEYKRGDSVVLNCTGYKGRPAIITDVYPKAMDGTPRYCLRLLGTVVDLKFRVTEFDRA